MKLETYISDLLYRYECVIVPGFGGFLTNEVGAQISEGSGKFYPPKKEIAFNVNLKNNDGLLANYISKVKKISYQAAVDHIDLTVALWKQKLEKDSFLELKNIGEIILSNENTLIFSADDKQNYLTSSYGLAAFSAPILRSDEINVDKVIELYQNTKEAPYRLKLLRYAAIVLPFAALASLAYYHQLSNFNLNFNNAEIKLIPNMELKVEKAVENTQETNLELKIQEVEEPKDEMAQTEIAPAIEEQKLIYHVVSSAFSMEKNAQKKIKLLEQKGIEANILGQNHKGLYIVSYQSFSDFAQAKEYLEKIRIEDQNNEAWIWKKNLK